MRLVVMVGRDFRAMEQELPHVCRRVKQAIEERRLR
jgi:hypothetical protein